MTLDSMHMYGRIVAYICGTIVAYINDYISNKSGHILQPKFKCAIYVFVTLP